MTITWPLRGLWHRRDERGGAAPLIAGAHQIFRCSFCGRTRFRSQNAVVQHERDAHQELIEQLLAEINAEAEAASLNPAVVVPP